jgi:hypothetical protein
MLSAIFSADWPCGLIKQNAVAVGDVLKHHAFEKRTFSNTRLADAVNMPTPRLSVELYRVAEKLVGSYRSHTSAPAEDQSPCL